MNKRYSKKIFPAYAFIPGLGMPHPEKVGGHMQEVIVDGERLVHYLTNEAYLFAVDLYNHGYYWESHVWWEYLWHLEGRKGETADFLKALIKLAAGRVKEKMGETEVAQQHYKRAYELFAPLESPYMGLNLKDISSLSRLEIN